MCVSRQIIHPVYVERRIYEICDEVHPRGEIRSVRAEETRHVFGVYPCCANDRLQVL